jgi:hypothetical protein
MYNYRKRTIIHCGNSKEFRNILLGQRIKVHTDHENLTYKTFNSEQVMRWQLYIEEYLPELQYIKGTHNVVPDALSWLDMNESPIEDTRETFLGLMECFGLKQPDETESHPLNFKHLLKTQEKDKTTMKILAMENTKDELQDFHGGGKTTALICYKNKKVVPGRLQTAVISWYHTTLCHPGKNRTKETIGQHLWWPNTRDHISNYVKICPLCQHKERRQKKYGLLPPKEAQATPWDKLCVDLIGPFKIRRKGEKELICLTLQPVGSKSNNMMTNNP